MEDWYEDIGGKIKKWAMTMCVIEAIAAIIGGIIILFSGAVLVGILTMIVGPFVAWVSTWLLYGFGELIEKTLDNEINTRQILEIMQQKDSEKAQAMWREKNKSTPPISHSWRCDNCGKMRTEAPCEHCGM